MPASKTLAKDELAVRKYVLGDYTGDLVFRCIVKGLLVLRSEGCQHQSPELYDWSLFNERRRRIAAVRIVR